MAKKPDSFVKSLTVNLPPTSKLRLMIESDEDLEAVIEEAHFEKECMANYDRSYQDGKTGQELMDELGYAEVFKGTTVQDRQKYYGYISQIYAVTSDINEDDDDYDEDETIAAACSRSDEDSIQMETLVMTSLRVR